MAYVFSVTSDPRIFYGFYDDFYISYFSIKALMHLFVYMYHFVAIYRICRHVKYAMDNAQIDQPLGPLNSLVLKTILVHTLVSFVSILSSLANL